MIYYTFFTRRTKFFYGIISENRIGGQKMNFFKKFLTAIKFYSSLGNDLREMKIFKVEAQLMVSELISDIFVFNKESINADTVAQIFSMFVEKFPILKKGDTQLFMDIFGVVTLMQITMVRKGNILQVKEELTVILFKELLKLRNKNSFVKGKEKYEILEILQKIDSERKSLV